MVKKISFVTRFVLLQMLFVLTVAPSVAQERQVARTRYLSAVSSSMEKKPGGVPVNKLGAYCPQRLNKPLGVMSPPAHQRTSLPAKSKSMKPIAKIKGGPLLWGAVEYSSEWNKLPENERPYGFYSFTASNPGNMNLLLKTGTNGPNAGGVFVNNDLYFVNYYLMYETEPVTYYYHYNTSSWEQIGYPLYGSDDKIIGTDLAYDATTNNVYGYFYNPLSFSEPSRFGIISYSDYGASVTDIATEDTLFLCLTADDAGQLYGISWGGGLWKIDKNTGGKELIDYMGVIPSTFRQSAAYDSKRKKIYWAAFRNDYTSGLYEIEPTTAVARLVTEFPDSMEISCLYIPKEEAEDGAPAAVADLAVAFDGSSLSGTANFNMPVETYSGDVLKGSMDYFVVSNGDTISRGKAQAGEKVAAPIAVETGMNEFSVYTQNEVGRSPQSNKCSKWVGYDIPADVTDVVFNYNAEDNKAALTWNAPTASLNGGYFDAAALTYDVVRFPGQDTVAQDIATTSFTEALPAGTLKAYYYAVTPHNGNQTGNAVQSNKQLVGDAFDLPFVDNFENDDMYPLYTIIDSNGDETTWNDSYHAFCYFFSWMNAADDWLLTPPMNMKKGDVYKLSFDIRGGSSYDKEKYSVAVGQGVDPAAYKEVIGTTELKSSDYSTVEKTFTVDVDGVSRIGFHAESDPYKSGIYITKIKVQKDVPFTAPDSVKNLKITAGEKGALKATVSFTTPQNDKNGNVLKSLSSVEIYRNDTVKVKTISNPATNTDFTVVDETPENGMAHYKVVAINGNGAGEAASDSAFIGYDVPFPPHNIALHGENNQLKLTWDAPLTTGVHGGYVDSSLLKYNVYSTSGEAVATDIEGEEWTGKLDLEAQTNVAYFFVDAMAAEGNSEKVSSPYFVIGKPAELPYSESFANGGTTKSLWWTYGSVSFGTFSFGSESSDEDDGSAYWISVVDDSYAYLNSGKITAKGTKRPVLSFDYYTTSGASTALKVIADCNQNDADTLVDYGFAKMSEDKTWHKAVVFLGDKEKKADYFVLKFLAQAKSTNNYVYIDNIEIRDMLDCDLESSIIAPLAVTAGDSIGADVTVKNLGFEDVSDATVDLMAAGEIVDTKPLPAMKQGDIHTLRLTYAPKMDASGQVKLYAVVNCKNDGAPENNTTDELNITIQRPDYPAVNNLSASNTAQGTELSWSAPETTKHVVTDNFDTYSPWIIDNIGKWNVVDGDKMETNAYTCMHYPNIGKEMAYIVFNNQYGTMIDEQRHIFAAHSGNQSLGAFATVHDYSKDIPTADWLITPELSGDAQTVSFWAKSFTDYKEDIMIYSSTEGGDTASLMKNRIAYEKLEVCPEWRKFEYDLPFGTKYFAVCYTSNLSGILIDDFTYEGKPLTIVGYNIYRDGKLLTRVAANTVDFVDTSAFDKNYKYAVTVLYAEGESDFSNVVQSTTDINTVDNRAVQNGKVYTVDGIKIADDLRNMKSSNGLYIINGRKVSVK